MAGFSRRAIAIRAAVCGLLCSGLPAACGLPDYRFVDTPTGSGGVGGSANPTRPRCASNADCAKYTTTKQCDLAGGHCVECISGGDATQAKCGAGLYCDVNRCAVGCADDAGCPQGLTCQVASHQCEGCTGDLDCPKGTACKDARCIPNCSDSSTCPTGYSCCNGVCAAFGSDPLHCGSCEKACADREDCINATCGEGSGCAPGFAECDGKLATHCEANLSNDRTNCGSCGVDCGTAYCQGGSCTTLECEAGSADCDHREDTGCETLLSSPDNCGVCNNKCSSINGQAACSAGKCSITCDTGFRDCDKNADTGCEVDLTTDPLNCGACNVACSNEHGSNVCRDGACVPTCATGFLDCNGLPEDGCETDVQSDVDHCGTCTTTCAVSNATPTCKLGVCDNQCLEGFADCNGGSDGCETDLSLPGSCGKCGVSCNDNGGTATCTEGVCGLTCKKGYADCNKDIETDGCETNTAINVNNCGACGTVCKAPPQGSASCVNGTCMISQCAPPLADCNADGTCEVNTNNDPKNCGGCGIECFFPHGSALCVNGSCTLDKCAAGYADCTTAAGCETQLGTTLNCSKCGEVCSNDHGGAACGSTGCQATCGLGYGDCDGKPANGCETQVNSLVNCGACAKPCSRPNATTSCATGVCEITGCSASYGDCDKEVPTPNGCETLLTSLTNCGTCGKPCDFANASESCSTGSCVQGPCTSGYADCSAVPGCETQLGSSSNCSGCGDLCLTTAAAHVTQNICSGTVPSARCSPMCQPGFGSCDANVSNGCESDITTPARCGSCTVACSLPNTATYKCQNPLTAPTCEVSTCNPGYANCNAPSATDGCERPVSSDIANCGDCNVACSSTNGTPKCTNGTCSTVCNAGFGDCNTDPLDGCERVTTDDPNNCGGCNVKCTTGALFCIGTACRQHLTIGVGQAQNGTSTGNANLTISHTLKAVNNYRMVVVGVAGRGNGSAGKPASVKYGNVTMNMVLQKEAQSSNQAWAGVYTLPNSQLPAVNTVSNVVITAGSSSGTFAMIGSVVELTNVEQATSFIDGTGGTPHGQCSTTVSDTISTATDGSLVYGVIGFYNSFNTGSANSGQTVLLTPTAVNSLGAMAGYVVPGAPVSNFSMSWIANNCDTSAQALLAIKPALTP